MLLSQTEIQQVQSLVKLSFPHFSGWEFSNEINENYSGFAIWGCFQLGGSEFGSTRFFVTFDKDEDVWQGHLTVGMHSFWWSSTDEEDARLMSTSGFASLNDAITEFKKKVMPLCSALLVMDVSR
jgi:hypothetical protein